MLNRLSKLTDPSFEEFVNSLSGYDVGFTGAVAIKYDEIVGDKLKHPSSGVYAWGRDSVDINGRYGGNVNGSSASWAAYLFLLYKRCGRRFGWKTGPFEDLWNGPGVDALDEDDD